MSTLSSLATLLALTLALTACGSGGPSSSEPSSSPTPSASPSSGNESVSFSTVSQRNSKIHEARTVTVSSSDEWEKLWAEHMGSDEDLPEVDFEKEAVVGVFMGQKPTGGYGVTIETVTLAGQKLQVVYSEKSPPADSMTTQVITHPSHLVKITKAGTAFSSSEFTKK